MSEILPSEGRLRRTPPDPAVPLINLVFLLLAFFLIAGTLARKDPVPLELPETPPLAGQERIYDAQIFIGPDGQVYDIEGSPATTLTPLFALMQEEGAEKLTIRADKRAPASVLLEAAGEASAAGFSAVRILTLNSTDALPQGQNK